MKLFIGVLSLFFVSTCFASTPIDQFNLKSSLDTVQNVSSLTLDQIKLVEDYLSSNNKDLDNKRVETAINYLKYYQYSKESLGQYPGPNLKLKDDNSKRG